MAGMPPVVRPPFLSLAALLLLVPVLAFAGGCSGTDGDAGPSGPTVTATGPDETSDTAVVDEPDPLTQVCAAYAAMVTAVRHAAASSSDPEEIAAEIAPVIKEFAAQVPALERPSGLPAATWSGIEALAARVVALPDAPSRAEIEAVVDDLTAEERSAFDDAAAWLKEHCA